MALGKKKTIEKSVPGPRGLGSNFARQFQSFLDDESGVGTAWALMCFILLMGIGGLAVDITSGFRMQTLLQATADSAALAGVIDLP